MHIFKAAQTPAVLLFGGLSVLARHARVIGEARQRGLEVLAVTSGGDEASRRLAAHQSEPAHPLAGIADWVVPATPRVDEVVAAVRDRFSAYRIEGVLSCGEVFVEACGQLADLFDLPGPGLRASRVCRDKQLQRSYLAAVSPHSRYLAPDQRHRAAELAPPFPCVVKPTGRMSSSGVCRVDDAHELARAVAQAREGEPLLLEEFVRGPEYSVEALVRDGEVIWENLTAKLTNESSGMFFAELEHALPAPAVAAPDRAALLAANRAVLSRLDFRTGISHAEFRLAASGPVLMEIAARVPGDGITLMLHLATGAPIEPVLLELALGRPASYPAPGRRTVHHYLQPPAGVLRDVTVDNGLSPVWIGQGEAWPDPIVAPAAAAARTAAVLVWRARNSVIGPARESDDRVASVVVDLPLDDAPGPAVAAQAARVRIDVVPA